MKLRSLLRLIVAAMLSGVFILAAVLVATARDVDEVAKVSRSLNDLTLGVAELYLLTQDYMQYPGSRPAEQWQTKWRSLQRQLREAAGGGLGDLLAGWMLRDLTGANAVFLEIVALQQPAPSSSKVSAQLGEHQRMLIGRLTVQLQSVLSNASQLRALAEEREAQLRRQGFQRAGAVLLLVVSIVTASAVVLMRRLAAPVTLLRKGAAHFGAGDLDYRLEVTSRDEFGELAGDLQRMAARLKEITASREELQREIDNRERAQELLRQLFDSSRDAIMNMAMDGRILTANRAAVELTGYSEDELRATTSKAITPPSWHEAEAALEREQLLPRGFTEVFEKEYVRKDGRVIPVGVRRSLVHDKEGQPVAAWEIVRDISQEKLAREERERLLDRQREAARQAEHDRAQVQAIFHSIREGISVFDMAGETKLVNPALPRMLGFPGSGDVNHNVAWFNQAFELRSVSGEPLSLAEWPVARVLAGESLDGWEARARRRDTGQEWQLEFSGAPVLDAYGRQFLAVLVTRDVTERKRLVEALQILNAELEQRVRERTAQLELANKELEAFSYSVSHDLKTPIRAVSGFVEILEEDFRQELSAEAMETIQVIRENAQRMQQLIDDLLAFSRLSRGSLVRAPCDMGDLVREVLHELLRGRRESVRCAVGDLPPAYGDRNLLRQVWINLLANAIKFSGTQAAPEIDVGGAEEVTEVVYFVRDNGVGFDMQYYNKLFGVFQRLHRQEQFSGTGVGLAIVQRIVVRHGGRVWAEGRIGGGAKFHFSLPKGVGRERSE